MFEKLSEKLIDQAIKVLERKDFKFSKKDYLDSAKVAFLFDLDQKFTTCLLRVGKGKKSQLTVGIAKRATYKGMADKFNEETGMSIAFSRAIRNFALGDKKSFVTL